MTDRELLDRFRRRRDEDAFAALVERHRPAVFAVCRRILRDVQEAEDVCQATFLVLVRKARAVRRPDLLASWLRGVARRLARKARKRAARRPQGEPAAEPAAAADPVLEAARRELRDRVGAELRRLPAKYRKPLVLCYLGGLTNEEAARRLGWPTGSISYRLARGRELLRDRLGGGHPHAAWAFLAALPGVYAVPALPLPPGRWGRTGCGLSVLFALALAGALGYAALSAAPQLAPPCHPTPSCSTTTDSTRP